MTEDEQQRFLAAAHLCRRCHAKEASGQYLTPRENRKFSDATNLIIDMEAKHPEDAERLWRQVPL